ncbi:sugar porter family MFS transporter [Occallatibacter riparius]|uniref:Sugar porter family MFS transporter n=1 Tax=Occallatibacter riparius TaxID=1002689 RepID=A0A9J7BSH4_9BACT|nr:sugar porter family MFS transporter [Occallatibacter riparius]UWZ85835.1 sugar porter family MFS transporter [Occallatibacter riparius]
MKGNLTASALGGSLAGLMFGYDIGAMSSAAPGVRLQFELSAAAFGFAVSAGLIGTIAGSIAAGFLADAIERRTTLLVSVLSYSAGILGAAFSNEPLAFGTCRILCGFAVGILSVAAPMYLAEVAPPTLRGRIVGAFQFSLSIGVVLAFVAGYLLSNQVQATSAWRYVLGTGALTAVPCAALLLWSSPSPRWLAMKGRGAEAMLALRKLGSADPEVECAELQRSMAQFAAGSPTLFARQYVRPILLAISIAVFNQLTGTNALLYYILDVFTDLGSGQLNGRKDAIVISTLCLIVTMFAVSIIDKVGRKPLLIAGTVAMGICLMLLPLVRVMNWPASLVVVILAAYNASFGFSQGVIVWVYLSEIFPLPVRARGQSLGSTVHWVCNAAIVGAFPSVIALLHERVFVVLAILMVVQFFVIILFYPETKRGRLETLASNIVA